MDDGDQVEDLIVLLVTNQALGQEVIGYEENLLVVLLYGGVL